MEVKCKLRSVCNLQCTSNCRPYIGAILISQFNVKQLNEAICSNGYHISSKRILWWRVQKSFRWYTVEVMMFLTIGLYSTTTFKNTSYTHAYVGVTTSFKSIKWSPWRSWMDPISSCSPSLSPTFAPDAVFRAHPLCLAGTCVYNVLVWMPPLTRLHVIFIWKLKTRKPLLFEWPQIEVCF